MRSPSGTKLKIVAQKDPSKFPSPYAFDRDCLAAPAETKFTIRLENRDVDSHNVDILDHPGGTSLFAGKIIKGPKTITYSVTPFPPGIYYFRCDVHPLRMNGTFVVD
jgi:plastocyanin